MLGLSLGLTDRPFDRSQAQQAMDAIRRNGGTLLLPGASTPVLGEELVTNGDFSNGTTGWASSSSTLAVTSGELVVTATSSTQPSASRAITVTPGVQHMLTIRCIADPANTIAKSARVRIGSHAGGGYIYSGPHEATSNGVYLDLSITFTPLAPTVYALLEVGSASAYGNAGDKARFDNISVKEILSYTHGNPPLRNYLDSAGTDLLDSVTQVDQPVGLVLDSMGVLGPDLTPPGTVWPNVGSATASSATLPITLTATSTGNPYISITNKLVVGKTYRVTIEWTGNTTNRAALVNADGAPAQSSPSASGVWSAVFVATSASTFAGFLSATLGETFTIVSVKTEEITGNHATQLTTASKPILWRGLVNQLLWSGDFTNAAWVKSGVTVTSGQADSSGGFSASRLKAAGGAYRYMYESAVWTAGQPATLAIRVKSYSGAAQAFRLTYGPAGSLFSPVFTADGNWQIFTVSFTSSSTDLCAVVSDANGAGASAFDLVVERFGLYQGTVTAQQILAAGGIPLTTTAPAPSALGNYWWQFDPAAPGDFLQTTKTVTISGDFTLVFAGSLSLLTGGWKTLIGGVNGANRMQLFVDPLNSKLSVYLNDGTTSYTTYSTNTVGLNVPFVACVKKTGSALSIRLNGVTTTGTYSSVSVVPITLGIATYNASASADPHQGACAGTVVSDQAIYDADLALIERWVGSLQGQTL